MIHLCWLIACWYVIFNLFDLRPPTDPNVSPHLEVVKRAAAADHHHQGEDDLTERERGYVRAALAYASGSLDNATKELSNMLFDYPRDGLAIRVMVGSYIVLAEFEKMRDLVGRVLPFWTEDTPLYNCILAFYGFALEECRERGKAEEVARKALAMDRRTPFATHAMAHIMEEAHHPREGVEFLTSTRSHWTGAVYEGHITWHLTLYYLDLGDVSKVLEEFDTHLKPKANKDNLFGLLDASSLLWRLEVMGIEVGEERWEVVTQGMTPHIHNHRSPWFDAHIMFSLARGKVCESTARLALAEGMMKSMHKYAADDAEDLPNQKLAEKLGVPVCNALLAFGQEKYDEVLQIMVPLRYEFLSFGGSWAQRQVFNVTMIQAAIKANNLSVALGLVAEMMAQKPHNPKYGKVFEMLQKSYKEKQGSLIVN
ncbi:tetratricopeptide repeat protein 38-like isoform X2 [Halichondria panicea]|uniref:tetratricopeptide repeat protein 38-like isoform X2 n=1 Tax=Halichondria panicea TaxID=6063 RepID=UPI00312B5B6E